jgi:hypothetical protein
MDPKEVTPLGQLEILPSHPTDTISSAVSCSEMAKKRGEVFEHCLEAEGLILKQEQNLSLHFVKIRAAVDVLKLHAQIVKEHLPLKKLTWCS